MNRFQSTTPTSLRDLASSALGQSPVAPAAATRVSLPTAIDLESPMSPEARAAMAAAVTMARFRINTDCRTLISTEQARAIARSVLAVYVETFRRVATNGGAL